MNLRPPVGKAAFCSKAAVLLLLMYCLKYFPLFVGGSVFVFVLLCITIIIFHPLMSRFREMKGLVEFDKIEKDLKYSREYMGLIQDIGLLDTEEFANTKEDQEVNIREVLNQCSSRDVLLFTDG